MENHCTFPAYHMNREKGNILDLSFQIIIHYYKKSKSIGHLSGLMYLANAYFGQIHFILSFIDKTAAVIISQPFAYIMEHKGTTVVLLTFHSLWGGSHPPAAVLNLPGQALCHTLPPSCAYPCFQEQEWD